METAIFLIAAAFFVGLSLAVGEITNPNSIYSIVDHFLDVLAAYALSHTIGKKWK